MQPTAATEDGVEFHFAREAPPEMHGAHLDGAGASCGGYNDRDDAYAYL